MEGVAEHSFEGDGLVVADRDQVETDQDVGGVVETVADVRTD